MSASMLYLLFLLLFIACKGSFLKTEPDVRSSIISVLEKVTVFIENRYRDINLDAVLGFRVLQGYLKGALEKWPLERELLAQHTQVESMIKKLSSLLEKACLYDLLSEFAPILGPHFWIIPHSWNQTDPLMAYSSFDAANCFTEKMSDACFTYLLGTWKENGNSCIVTSACRNAMTKPACSNYCLSHQLLYFLFADVKGCSDLLFLRTQDYKNIFCASMMKINLEIENNGFNVSSRDLFMENTGFFCILFPLVMLCGMSGFSDFYKLRWLEKILTWQMPKEGCFGEPSKELERSSGVENQKKLLRRVKRREKMFAGI
uniref:Chromosome 16 open reading frame 89 n=1 Tax=Phasianus colchicus TaxID=9054 RepID=A0A669PRR8_PHACC